MTTRSGEGGIIPPGLSLARYYMGTYWQLLSQEGCLVAGLQAQHHVQTVLRAHRNPQWSPVKHRPWMFARHSSAAAAPSAATSKSSVSRLRCADAVAAARPVA